MEVGTGGAIDVFGSAGAERTGYLVGEVVVGGRVFASLASRGEGGYAEAVVDQIARRERVSKCDVMDTRCVFGGESS